jgi:UDP-N-acetylglucosamine 2-epimerase (non-hydrolysing)
MAQQFFDELKIPDADYNLNIGSGTHAEQTAKMIVKIERILLKEKPDLTIVIGDSNTTLAGALASVKIHIPVAHIEAGLRSYNWIMVEEINRVLTDHCSHILFAPTENAVANLLKEGIEKRKIFLTGDITVDVLKENLKKAEKSNIMKKFGLKKREFILLTLHRAENVDNKKNLQNILLAISKFSNVVFPIHPRTEKMINKFWMHGIVKNIRIIEPLGYFDFLKLLKNASVVVTDSGGVQKEAFLVKTPCVTLRNETEWIETVRAGANILSGIDSSKIIYCIKKMKNKKLKKNIHNPFGTGRASDNIISVLKKIKR